MGKYIVVVALGIAAGWMCQRWFDETSSRSELIEIATRGALPEVHRDVVAADSFEPKAISSNRGQAELDAEPELTAMMLIQNLSSMDRAAFRRYLNDFGSGKKAHSHELLMELLAALPTISDSATWYRLIDLITVARSKGFDDREYEIENWIVDKIKIGEQNPHWLEILSHLGVENLNNIEFITGLLDNLNSSKTRVSALLSLSRSFGFEFLNRNYTESDFNEASVSESVMPYLDSANELERAAAISALGRFPSSNYAHYIADALEDPSERVRVSAMMTLGGRNRISEGRIKQTLLLRMQEQGASDLERLTAWQMLKLMPIEGEYYQAAYEFGVNDQERLSRRYRNQARPERNQWGF